MEEDEDRAVVRGTRGDDRLAGTAGGDDVRGVGGDDLVDAARGADRVAGSRGADRIAGGAGPDALAGGPGDDRIDGDGFLDFRFPTRTASTTVTVEETGEDMTLSVTAPTRLGGVAADIAGTVDTGGPTGQLRVALAIDVSGSAGFAYEGTPVGDANFDGEADTTLDAEVVAAVALLRSLARDVPGDPLVSIIAFDEGAETVYSGGLGSGSEGGLRQALDAVRALRVGNGTDYEAGLSEAIPFFAGSEGPTTDVLFFLSDGTNFDGTDFSQEVDRLRDLGVDIRPVGIENADSAADLDLVDDGRPNGSVTFFDDPGRLDITTVGGRLTGFAVDRLDIFVGGDRAARLGPDDFEETADGIAFAASVAGFVPGEDDALRVVAVADDGAATEAVLDLSVPEPAPIRAGDDEIAGGDGDDFIDAGDGADVARGGRGDDVIIGDSPPANDGEGTTRTVSDAKTVPSTGQDIAISLTVPETADGRTAKVSGFVSTGAVAAEANVVVVVDVSGSTGGAYDGTLVGDRNGDGVSDTTLDAEIAGAEALIRSIREDAGLGGAEVSIIPFSSTASTLITARADADADRNGLFDVEEALAGLRSIGGTDYEAALQQAVKTFEAAPEGENILFFLSDGANGSGQNFLDEVAVLRDTLGVDIRSIGLQNFGSTSDIDLVDDGLSNGSAEFVEDPGALTTTIVGSGVEVADVRRVDIVLNGEVVKKIPAGRLRETPLGLRFEADLTGLDPLRDDRVAARVLTSDEDRTRVAVAEVIAEPANPAESGGNDTLLGGGGSDTLIGLGGDDMMAGRRGNDRLVGCSGEDTLKGGDGNDQLIGGPAADVLRGGAGDDRIRGGGAEDFASGGAGQDRLFGAASDDHLRGGGGDDLLRGGNGNDTVLGGNGEDTLDGGGGDDALVGGKGADVFIYRGDKDTIVDFDGELDALRIRGEGRDLSTFLEVAVEVDGDVVADFGGGDVLVLLDTTLAAVSGPDLLD